MSKLTKVKIYGQTYKIVRTDMPHFGICDPNTYTIYIRSDLEGEMLTITMLHEIVHAILFRAGLGQAIPEPLWEVICEQFAIVIAENFTFSFK